MLQVWARIEAVEARLPGAVLARARRVDSPEVRLRQQPLREVDRGVPGPHRMRRRGGRASGRAPASRGGRATERAQRAAASGALPRSRPPRRRCPPERAPGRCARRRSSSPAASSCRPTASVLPAAGGRGRPRHGARRSGHAATAPRHDRRPDASRPAADDGRRGSRASSRSPRRRPRPTATGCLRGARSRRGRRAPASRSAPRCRSRNGTPWTCPRGADR